MADGKSLEKHTFRVAFTGEDVETGVMRVGDVAPVLLAIQELCDRTNEILNRDQAAVHVRISHQFREGSFEMIFELWQSLPEEAKALFADYALVHSQEILEILGFVAGSSDSTTVQSVIELFKWLRGQKPAKVEKVETAPDQAPKVTLENVEGETITVNQNTYNVAGDLNIHNSFEIVLQPLEQSGIDSFEVREGKRTVTSISGGEVPFFQLPETPEELLNESETDVVAELISPHFREGLKWRFSAGKGQRFTAEMHDSDFLGKLDRREQQFGKGDIVRMRLHSLTYQTPSGIRTEHNILKVLSVSSPPSQMALGA